MEGYAGEPGKVCGSVLILKGTLGHSRDPESAQNLKIAESNFSLENPFGRSFVLTQYAVFQGDHRSLFPQSWDHSTI